MSKRVLVLVAALALSACATGSDGRFVGTGGGSYDYKHTYKDGSSCAVSVVSGRDVQGAELTIDKDCQVKSGVAATRGAEAALMVIDNGISGLREAVSKIP